MLEVLKPFDLSHRNMVPIWNRLNSEGLIPDIPLNKAIPMPEDEPMDEDVSPNALKRKSDDTMDCDNDYKRKQQ
jgi:hypothetical protein